MGHWQRAPFGAAAVFALSGGLGATVFSRRAFSTTACRQASEPAPNVASALPEGASDAATDALSTLADPAVFGWWPSSFAELGIVAVHEATGLPWFQCIAGITLAVRTMLFPLVIYQMQNVARLAMVKPEMELVTKRWKALGGYSAPPQASEKYKDELSGLFKKHNCSPGRSMIGVVVQAPLFISFFFALRKMSETYPSFQTGGMMWFTDLSLADPSYVLPVIASMTMLASIELGADTGQSMQQQQGNMKMMFRGLSIFMVPCVIIGGIPNGVFMYWITANSFSLCQVLLLKIPGLKEALGIPDMAKITADQAAAAGQSGQPAAVKAPVIPSAVFASRAHALRAQDVDSPAASTAPPAAGMAKGKRVKRSPQGARKMHIFSTSRPLLETATQQLLGTSIIARDYRAPGFFRRANSVARA